MSLLPWLLLRKLLKEELGDELRELRNGEDVADIFLEILGDDRWRGL